MDIWHTCEPLKIGDEGWVGRLVRELDPAESERLNRCQFRTGAPSRACALAGVPVTSIGDLDNYGLMTSIGDKTQRTQALDIFKKMYGSTIGSGIVMDYLSQTGLDVIKGADELKKAPEMYTSEVEYPQSSIAKKPTGCRAGPPLLISAHASFIHNTRGYDNHANEVPAHPKLLKDLTEAIQAFFTDLRSQNASEEIVMYVFTEFGRRIRDNASGTDHGTGARCVYYR